MNVPITEIGRPSLAVKAFGITDNGSVRPTNEDQFLIAELTKSMRIWQTSLPEPKAQIGEERAHLFLVADGMGGHRAGERASALAVVAIEQFTLNTFKWFFDSDGTDAQRVLDAVPVGAPPGRRAHPRGIGGASGTERHGHDGDDGVPSRRAAVRRPRRRQPGVPVRGRRAAPAHAGPHADGGDGPPGSASARGGRASPSPPCHHERRRRQRSGRQRRSPRARRSTPAIACCSVRTD